MTLTEQQQNEFETAAQPLIEWLNKNCDPMVTAIVQPAHIELLEGVFGTPIKDLKKCKDCPPERNNCIGCPNSL